MRAVLATLLVAWSLPAAAQTQPQVTADPEELQVLRVLQRIETALATSDRAAWMALVSVNADPDVAGRVLRRRRAARRDPRGGARARPRAARRRPAGRRLPADRRGVRRERPARPALHLAARHPPAGRHDGGRRRDRHAVADRRPRSAVAGRRAAPPRPRSRAPLRGAGLRPHLGGLRAAAAGRATCSSPTPPRASPRWCCSATAR